ncbi:LuxR family transcriptional regulator [Nocardioides sp. YIM 152315]|uniref:LuxR family transcriptional regulator n=1 Tax=Nocardioides sp. YIM 152315 TaxID=3031760 RepID=UPI0023D9C081|nr:LuxR family transcriptional regulator [Nocardioides sp. YIM 152315]MDF1604642.1 LuxR family transcriptional regulator [Nocardioides sp. YIM 152315]
MGTSDAEDRALFETAGTALYEEIVTAGGIVAGEPRIVAGGELHDAFEQLRELGLVRLDPERETWVAEDPGLVHTRVVAPLTQQGAELLQESSRWTEAFATVSHAWRRAPGTSERGPFRYLHGDSISSYLHTVVPEAEEEVLTAQPQTGRDTGKGLEDSLLAEKEMLERGVRILTLYQHSARRSTATREYVEALAPLGAEVRTQDEFFNRMIVVDRRTAIIPSTEDRGTALAIREPTIVAYLVDVFMRSWERARPFTSQEASVVKGIAEEQRAMTMRMLIEGHSDPVSAKRLGVSPRTYAGYVADLKEEFDAETRFQLGYSLGRLGPGVDGSGPDDDPREND